jgi:hypothetical protein
LIRKCDIYSQWKVIQALKRKKTIILSFTTTWRSPEDMTLDKPSRERQISLHFSCMFNTKMLKSQKQEGMVGYQELGGAKLGSFSHRV